MEALGTEAKVNKRVLLRGSWPGRRREPQSVAALENGYTVRGRAQRPV